MADSDSKVTKLAQWIVANVPATPEISEAQKFAKALISDKETDGRTNLYRYTILKRIYNEAVEDLDGEVMEIVEPEMEEAFRQLPGELASLIPWTPPDWGDAFNSFMYIKSAFAGLEDGNATKEELWEKLQQDQSWWGKLKTGWGNFFSGLFGGKEDESEEPEVPDNKEDIFNALPPPSDAVVEVKERPNKRREFRLRWKDENGEVPPPDENDEKEGWVRYQVWTGQAENKSLSLISSNISSNVINQGTLDVYGKTITFNKSDLINDGLINITGRHGTNEYGLYYNTTMTVLEAQKNLTITGTGEIHLDHSRDYYATHSSDTQQLNSQKNATIINDVNHTISGNGTINASLINLGTIKAHNDIASMIFADRDKTNKNLITATQGTLEVSSKINNQGSIVANGGSVLIKSTVNNDRGKLLATNSGGLSIYSTIKNNKGEILAKGGSVELRSGGKVIGGILDSKGKSAIVGVGGTVEDITNKGQFNINPGTTTIAGKTRANASNFCPVESDKIKKV